LSFAQTAFLAIFLTKTGIMEKELQEQYEYARKRIRQKKVLYFHFILFLLGSLFMYVANALMEVGAPTIWYTWVIAGWLFLLILHFIKVYITDRFMNKDWERDQVNKLVTKQQNRLEKIKQKTANES
jgi:amino acid transporter